MAREEHKLTWYFGLYPSVYNTSCKLLKEQKEHRVYIFLNYRNLWHFHFSSCLLPETLVDGRNKHKMHQKSWTFNIRLWKYFSFSYYYYKKKKIAINVRTLKQHNAIEIALHFHSDYLVLSFPNFAYMVLCFDSVIVCITKNGSKIRVRVCYYLFPFTLVYESIFNGVCNVMIQIKSIHNVKHSYFNEFKISYTTTNYTVQIDKIEHIFMQFITTGRVCSPLLSQPMF